MSSTLCQDILLFYSKSKDLPAGSYERGNASQLTKGQRGIGYSTEDELQRERQGLSIDRRSARYQEQVTHPDNYLELNAIPDWRKVLSNFYVFDFKAEVAPDTILTFRTIEHGFHYFKIRLADPSRAFDFALESGSELSKGDGLDAQRARKLVVLNTQQLEEWDAIKESVLYSLSKCRFSQDPLSKQVLLATRDAQLWHIVPQRNPIRFTHLEQVREELKVSR